MFWEPGKGKRVTSWKWGKVPCEPGEGGISRWRVNRALRAERIIFHFTKEIVDYPSRKENEGERNHCPHSHCWLCTYPIGQLLFVSPLTVGIIHFQASGHWLGACSWAGGDRSKPGTKCNSGISASSPSTPSLIQQTFIQDSRLPGPEDTMTIRT